MSVSLMGRVFYTKFEPVKLAGVKAKHSKDGKAKPRAVSGAAQKIVMLALADSANDDGKSAYPSLSVLEMKTNLARRTVCLVLLALKQSGYIVRVGVSDKRTANYNIVATMLVNRDYQQKRIVNRDYQHQGTGTTDISEQGLPNTSFNHPYPSSIGKGASAHPRKPNGNGNGHRMTSESECITQYQNEFEIAKLTKTQKDNLQQAHDHNPTNWPRVLAWAAGAGVRDTARILSAARHWRNGSKKQTSDHLKEFDV